MHEILIDIDLITELTAKNTDLIQIMTKILSELPKEVRDNIPKNDMRTLQFDANDIVILSARIAQTQKIVIE